MGIKITAPNTSFDGKVAGVRFDKGTATVDAKNTAALAYFRRQGYGISGEEPEGAEREQQTAQAQAGAFVPDEKLLDLSGDDLKAIAKDLGVAVSGAKPAIAQRIIEKRAENGAKSIEKHDARDGADRNGDGVQDSTTVPSPAGGEQNGEADAANAVKGASEHESVREVEGA